MGDCTSNMRYSGTWRVSITDRYRRCGLWNDVVLVSFLSILNSSVMFQQNSFVIRDHVFEDCTVWTRLFAVRLSKVMLSVGVFVSVHVFQKAREISLSFCLTTF